MSPATMAALYRVEAGTGGVELIGNATDQSGRRGVAVAVTTSYRSPGERLILIFDPAISALR